jgi:hypothetical protein
MKTNPIRSITQLAVQAAALFLLACPALAAQQNPGPLLDPTQMSTRFPDKTVTIDSQGETQDMRRMRLLNTARQKAMISDAEKLLDLARDLNAGIGPDGTTLSVAQKMRMAADIEKLAHSVKEKMSYVAGAPSLTRNPMPPAAWPQ